MPWGSWGLPAAISLNQPESKEKVVDECFNLTEQLLNFSAGSTIGTFTWVEADQVDDHPLGVESKETRVDNAVFREKRVPRHLQQLYNAPKGSCHLLEEFLKFAGLLTKYSTVFRSSSFYQRDAVLHEGGYIPSHQLSYHPGLSEFLATPFRCVEEWLKVLGYHALLRVSEAILDTESTSSGCGSLEG